MMPVCVIEIQMTEVSQAQLLGAARKFKKRLLLQKVAARLQDCPHLASPPELLNPQNNFPPHLDLVAFYPEHTLSLQSQSVMKLLVISMTLFVCAMVFNSLLQVVHVIRSTYLPFLLGFVYLASLIPWFFKFVFLRLYNDLQYGRVTQFYFTSTLTALSTCGLLLAPTQLGTPSVFEIISHMIRGLIEIGVLFSLVSMALFVSLVLLLASIWKTAANAGGMFALEEPNLDCL
jgi:hypothetical protein